MIFIECIILSHFDVKEGPKIFLKAPINVENEEFEKLPLIMNLYEEGFFIHIFGNYKSANLIFNITSKFVRGNKELLLITLIVDQEQDIDLNLSKELLEGYATDLKNLKGAYKAFHLELNQGEKGMDKYVNLKHSFLTFFRNIQPALKALGVAELRYRHLFENSPNMLLLLDSKGVILDANPAYLKYFKYNKDEIFEIHFRDQEKISHDTKLLFMEIYRKVLEQGHIEPVEIPIETRDKKNRWMSLQAYVIEFEPEKLILVRMMDISKRKEIEQQLVESEKKYRGILESIQDGYYEVDLKGNYTFFSDQFCKIVGHTKYELNTMMYKDVISKKDADMIHAIYYEIYKGKKQHNTYNFKFKRKDGSVVYLESTANLKRNEKGVAVGFYGLTRDVTNRTKAEQKLKESEEQYRSTINYMVDALCVIDKDHNIVLMNQPYLNWLKELNIPSDVIGHNIFEAFTFLSEKVKEEYKMVFETGKFLMTEESTKFGNIELYTETYKIPIVSEGAVIRVITIIRDITDRKEMELELMKSEQKYRLITDNMDDVISILDENLNIEFTNENVILRNMGYTAEDIKGKTALSFLHPEDVKKALNMFRKGLETGQGTIEVRFRNKKDEWIWYQIKGGVFYNENGEKRALMVGRDINDLKRAQDELIKSEERYKFILENVNDLIVLLDEDFRISYINQVALESLLIFNQNELFHHKVNEFIHPEDLIKAIDAIKEGFKTGKGKAKIRVRRRDNTYLLFDFKGRTVIDSDGKTKVLLVGRVLSKNSS